jgi:hypothetical protein
MTIKMIRLTYRGGGMFTTTQTLSLTKGQTISVYLSPTPITDATRGVIKLPRRVAARLATDPELSVWNSRTILRRRWRK